MHPEPVVTIPENDSQGTLPEDVVAVNSKGKAVTQVMLSRVGQLMIDLAEGRATIAENDDV